MKTILKMILLVLLVICCEKNEDKNYSSVEKIDLSEVFLKKEKLNLSNIALNIEYIPLQTDSICLIGELLTPQKDLHFFNNKILVNHSFGQLLLFDLSGKFLNKIGALGRGPEEYTKVDDFTPLIDKNNDSLIAVLSDIQRKVFFYNYKGKYVRDFSIDFWPFEIASFSNDLVFINYLGGRKESNYRTLSILSTEGEIKKRLLYKENEKKIEKNNVLQAKAVFNKYVLKDTLSYWESNYDTIWRITEKFETIPEFTIDIGGNKMPFDKQTKINYANNNGPDSYDEVIQVHESSKYIFFRTSYKERLHHLYYNKNSKESHCVEYKESFGKNIAFSFYNNIDGGMPFWPMGRVSDNKMFMITYGYEIKDYIERIGDNYDAIDPEGRERLLKLIEHSKISDNPILMVVTFKE